MNDILALTAAAAFVSLCGVAVSVGRLVRRVRAERHLVKKVWEQSPEPATEAVDRDREMLTVNVENVKTYFSELLKETSPELEGQYIEVFRALLEGLTIEEAVKLGSLLSEHRQALQRLERERRE